MLMLGGPLQGSQERRPGSVSMSMEVCAYAVSSDQYHGMENLKDTNSTWRYLRCLAEAAI